VTLEVGDILYMPRGFVHEAFTSSSDASLHLTIALATADWTWSVLAARLLSNGKKQDGTTVLAAAQFRKEVEAMDTNSHLWRHSVPPGLICDEGISTEKEAEEAMVLADKMMASDERLKDFSGEEVAAMLIQNINVHNQRQDSVAPPVTTGRCLTEESYVRRLTEEEKEEAEKKKKEKEGGGGGGLVAREELYDVLLRIIGDITTTPVQIKSFEDAELLCPFSKVCFGEVCVVLGILAPCAADGTLMLSVETD